MSVHRAAQQGAKTDGFHWDKGNLITWPLIKHHSLSGLIKLPSVMLTSADTKSIHSEKFKLQRTFAINCNLLLEWNIICQSRSLATSSCCWNSRRWWLRSALTHVFVFYTKISVRWWSLSTSALSAKEDFQRWSFPAADKTVNAAYLTVWDDVGVEEVTGSQERIVQKNIMGG